MKRIIIIILMLFFNIIGYGSAEKRIIYNQDKNIYEVYNEKGILTGIINNNKILSKKLDKNLILFPYQNGFPVQTLSACYYGISIGDLNGDNYKELYVNTEYNGNNIYDFSGNLLYNVNWGMWVPSIADIDFDGINEIIGSSGDICGNYACGITVRKLNGEELNGFPNPAGAYFYSNAIEDIDRDGNYEVIIGNANDLSYVDNKLGLYAVGSWGGILPGFPVIFPCNIPPPPYCRWPGSNYASPTVGDFDDDGIEEIIVGAYNARLYLIRANGSHFRNWPIKFYEGAETNFNPPAIADIDNDGKLELTMTDETLHKLYVFNEDANMLAGFPVNIDMLAYRSPGIADIDKDGKLELYAEDGSGRLFGFRNDGTNLPGWPVDVEEVVGGNVFFGATPIIGDIDGDGEMEIIAFGSTGQWCPDGVLVAYNFDGTLVNGFPIIIEYYHFWLGGFLADLDNDGDIEICTGSEFCLEGEKPAYVFCWDLPYPYDETKIAWNSYAHDIRHTGRYFNPEIKPPRVGSVEPNYGTFRGRTNVIIKGRNFMNGAKVFFGGVPAEEVEVIDSNTIRAKTPPHKPCFMYVNDINKSPYELSYKLVNQPVKAGEKELGNGIRDYESSAAYHYTEVSNAEGCKVNVVVVHPTPDQREGILRAGFTYTGWEPPKEDIVLKVSKYSPVTGTFENNASNWGWMYPDGLWGILDDSSNCLPKPFPQGHKVMYFGKKDSCNYDIGKQTHGELEMPFIHIDRADAKLRFWYYRDVEYIPNPNRQADIFKIGVLIPEDNNSNYVIFYKDGRTPSEKQWVQVELDLGEFVGKDVIIRFWFDSVDDIWNDAKGIAIDNVEIIGAHYLPWAEFSGEVHLEWTGGLPKYFVYRGTNPDFDANPPELRAYTPFNHIYENSLNDYESYYYKIR
jgi:hypothetical protein